MSLNRLQSEWIIHALLDAFPRYADFKYMVAIQLGKNIETMVPLGSNLRDCALELVVQMDAQGKIIELLDAALRENPHNPLLLECQIKLGLTRQRDIAEVSARPPAGGLPLPLCTALVTALLRLPGIQWFDGRSTLLRALPSVHTLDRNSSNTRQDLVSIVDQLAQLGQISSREWPLILLLDTVLEDIRGYALEEDIQQLRRQLVEHYGGA